MELDRGKLGQVFMVAAGVVALLTIGRFPAGWVVYSESGGERVVEGSGVDWVGVLLACSTIAAGVFALVALMHYRRRRWVACRMALVLSIVFGLTALLPAAFSLAAFIAVKPTMRDSRVP
ncbi:MAG TPA: hypothetical protein VGB74_20845 [Actinoplanes sp.]|jgi:hypothetical protein